MRFTRREREREKENGVDSRHWIHLAWRERPMQVFSAKEHVHEVSVDSMWTMSSKQGVYFVTA